MRQIVVLMAFILGLAMGGSDASSIVPVMFILGVGAYIFDTAEDNV